MSQMAFWGSWQLLDFDLLYEQYCSIFSINEQYYTICTNLHNNYYANL